MVSILMNQLDGRGPKICPKSILIIDLQYKILHLFSDFVKIVENFKCALAFKFLLPNLGKETTRVLGLSI